MQIPRLALILALVIPSAAGAQNELGVSLGGGFSFPVGEVTETHGNGLNFAARTYFPISPRVSVEMAIGYQDIRLKHEREARRRGHDWQEFRLGGGFIEGGNRRSLGVLGHGMLYLLPRAGRFAPYLLAGAGVSQVRTPDTNVYFLGSWDRESGSQQVTVGADIGGGLQLRIGGPVGIIAQASYLTLFTDNGSTAMVPASLGLIVEMGSR